MNDPDILAYQHDYYKPILDKAIKLTEEYISANKLMLTGGMAIDLALRVHGQSIYGDDQLPDYDIISDRNLHHARELAKILCGAGIQDVNIINAVHVTTVRVRVKRNVLLDATYIPSTVFERIPYLDTGNLRVVHPHYQMIDQRSSLGMLMLDKGITLNVFNRLKKDIKRNNMLRAVYPIQASDVVINYANLSIPLSFIRIDEARLNKIDANAFIYTGKACVSGYLAFYLYMSTIDPKTYPVSVEHDNLIVRGPAEFKIEILSYEIDEMKELLHNPTTYRQLLSIKPITLMDDRYEVMDSYGYRIGCYILKLPSGDDICVASVDYVLYELLRDRMFTATEPYTTFYTQLLSECDRMRESADSPEIWYPSVNCYGHDNMPEYRALMLEMLMRPDATKHLKPRNEYLRIPQCNIRDETFDATASHYFRIDGVRDDSIEHTNYKSLKNEFMEFAKNKRTASAQ